MALPSGDYLMFNAATQSTDRLITAGPYTRPHFS
jgi:hypothetical protein